MKRLWVLLVLLAGCTLPGGDEGEPELFGSCPQWIASDQVLERTIDAQGAAEANLSAETVFQDHPLDMYLLEIRTDAPLRVEAYAGGVRRSFSEVEDDRLLNPPSITVDGERELRVFLSPVEQGSPPAPGPLRLVFEGDGHVEVDATPFYRVCGVLPE